MNHQYAIQQGSSFGPDKMMMLSSATVLTCPKPRRVRHLSQQQEACDAKAANDLLDIILAKGVNGDGVEKQSADSTATQLASSPPFFSGSPPSRVSNPLIQDARFGHVVAPISPRALPIPSGLAPSPSSARMGGCVRANFANNPAVRVEGFDCFNRDRRNGSIPALA